jgi:hypothetical protein
MSRVREEAKQRLMAESRNQCAICGSKRFLQLAHITPMSEGGSSTPENIIVLCPTCHMGIDSSRIAADLLKGIKRDWIENEILGKEKIAQITQDLRLASGSHFQQGTSKSTEDLVSWSDALRRSDEFDAAVRSIVEELGEVNSEDDFVHNVLKPLFDAMGFEGVTCLHHTGRPEYGKDIVFYERDRLGGFTYYAVVACVGKIYAASSKAKTRNSGHYQKIIDQVEKCFTIPYEDHNSKGKFYIDKVIVACSANITEEALQLFREWEKQKRRRLIFWDSQNIAGHKLRLHLK